MSLKIENVREKTQEIHISHFSEVEERSPAEGPGSRGRGGWRVWGAGSSVWSAVVAQ